MKKLILTITLALAASSLPGQGTINFNNATSTYGTATPSHLITIWPGGQLVSSNYAGINLSSLRALLYYGATTQNSIAGLTAATAAPATFRGSTSANVGSWVGGGIVTLTGFDVGSTINAAVLVWDSRDYAMAWRPTTPSRQVTGTACSERPAYFNIPFLPSVLCRAHISWLINLHLACGSQNLPRLR